MARATSIAEFQQELRNSVAQLKGNHRKYEVHEICHKQVGQYLMYSFPGYQIKRPRLWKNQRRQRREFWIIGDSHG